jgi:four helix bundle protein
MSGDYRNLIAWQKAKRLALDVYRCTRRFPKDETYGLSSQMRRAAVSVPSNIAEGKGRHSHKDLVHFLYQARGSLLELETQISIDEISNTSISLHSKSWNRKPKR